MSRLYPAFVALVASHIFSPSAQAFAESVAGWDVSEVDSVCAAIAEYQGPGSTQVSFIKGVDGWTALGVTNYEWSAKKDAKYDITVALDDEVWSGGKATGVNESNGRKGFLYGFSSTEIESDFSKASSLRILLGDKLIDRLELSGSAAAVASVNRCLAGVKRRVAAEQREQQKWADLPKDPFAAGAGQSRPQDPVPRGSPGAWALFADYPQRALLERKEGVVGFTATVGTDGKVLNCKVSQSSGSAELDEATCLNVTRRARFSPALDAAGQAVAGEYRNTMRWVLPE